MYRCQEQYRYRHFDRAKCILGWSNQGQTIQQNMNKCQEQYKYHHFDKEMYR